MKKLECNDYCRNMHLKLYLLVHLKLKFLLSSNFKIEAKLFKIMITNSDLSSLF